MLSDTKDGESLGEFDGTGVVLAVFVKEIADVREREGVPITFEAEREALLLRAGVRESEGEAEEVSLRDIVGESEAPNDLDAVAEGVILPDVEIVRVTVGVVDMEAVLERLTEIERV
jgi:hypothetical protein